MNSNDNGGNNGGKKPPQNKKIVLICLIITLMAVLLLSYITKTVASGSVEEITYNRFLDMLENGEVEEVVIKSDRIMITPKQKVASYYNYTITYYTGYVYDPALVERLCDAGTEEHMPAEYQRSCSCRQQPPR